MDNNIEISKEYKDRYEQLVNGIITESEWKDYCISLFNSILDENKEVLIRLKNK